MPPITLEKYPQRCRLAMSDSLEPAAQAIRRLFERKERPDLDGIAEAVRAAPGVLEHPVRFKGGAGRTLLHLAAWKARPQVVKLLLDMGSDPNRVSEGDFNYGKTAVMCGPLLAGAAGLASVRGATGLRRRRTGRTWCGCCSSGGRRCGR